MHAEARIRRNYQSFAPLITETRSTTRRIIFRIDAPWLGTDGKGIVYPIWGIDQER
jgi:hypothetical protein